VAAGCAESRCRSLRSCGAWPNTRLNVKREQQLNWKSLMNKLLRENVLLGIGWTVVPWSMILAILIWTFFH
jgi:hypothetical protein